MVRILITGVKAPAGGVESIVMAYASRFSPEAVITDFAVFGDRLPFEDEITARGGKVYYLPDRRSSYKLYKASLDDIFKKNKYDAVWCNFSGLTNIDFLKTAKRYGVEKRIAHAHTSGYFWGNRIMKYVVPVLHNINKVFLPNYANHFWKCSEKASLFMFGKRLTESKAVTVRNAINASAFIHDECVRQEVRNEFNIGNDTLTLGHVGRMCTAKNQLFLLDIMKEVLRTEPKAKLLFIGDGELHDQVTSYARELSLGDSVIFTGSRNDVPRLLQAFDIFVLPSVSEGLPVVLVEAQAAGVPCVTSEFAVTKEVDVTGDVTFLPLTKSAGEWAKEIIEIAKAKPVDSIEKVRNAGYDICTEAKKLEQFFMETTK